MPPRKQRSLPVIPLREAVLFPGALAPLSVGREASLAALEAAGNRGRLILVVAQKDAGQDIVGPEDIYGWGTIGEIEGVRRVMGSAQLVLRGVARARIDRFIRREPFLEADYAHVRERTEPGLALDALVASLRDAFEAYVASGASIPQEAAQSILRTDDPGMFSDLVAGVPDLTVAQKQSLLETSSVEERLRSLVVEISRQKEVLELKNRIQSEVEGTFGQAQKEQVLREQLKAIRRELGEPEEGGDLEELRLKVDGAGMPEKVVEKARRELGRLEAMPTISPEHGMLRSYLDWLVSVPWKDAQPDPDWDTVKAKRILDEDHYGLDKVKERILEYMAVRERVEAQTRAAAARDEARRRPRTVRTRTRPETRHARSPILCLVGPPGVGKTSLGRSVARALGREVVRISLGG
ncbi:MAG: LON peptidase substrate-binding domain-containing protein, partial [Candidatus Dormibacteria bacterium]